MTSTSNLEWTLSTFFKADKKLLPLKNSGKSIYDVLNEELAATEPESSGVMTLTELTPGADLERDILAVMEFPLQVSVL